MLTHPPGPRGPPTGPPARVNACVRAPRDLGAVFPDGCPVRAARHCCRASSPGVVQRSPLHRSRPWSPSPERRAGTCPLRLAFPSGWECRFPSAFRPRSFSPPRRLAPPRPCDPIAGRSRSWGSPCFNPSRNGPPHGAPAALRSFPSADSDGDGEVSAPWRASPAGPFPVCRSPRSLPPRPFACRRNRR